MEPQETVQERSRLWRLLRFTGNAFRSYLGRLLHIEEENKVEIYKNVFRGAEFTDLNYWLEIIFSIGIATLGLITNSPAVVIGAMLISPLMGPIISSGLAIALGDFYLGFKSLVSVALSTIGSIALAAMITWVLPFRSPTQEILARVQPSLLDLGIAILSGMAGAVVLCRGGKGGGINALPGVAVAVALMPPLGVVGFGVGSGWEWTIISGGGLLFLTNLVAIIFSSFLVFFSVRLDTVAARAKISDWLEDQKGREPFHDAILKTFLRRMLGRVGSLPQRLLILGIFLAMVTFPLQRTLVRLKEEATIRRTIIDELNRVIPRDSVFQQTTDILADRINIRLVVVLPEGLPLESQRKLEETISLKANLPAKLSVVNVATKEELSQWSGRLTATRTEPVVVNVEELRAKLLARVEPAFASVWPADSAPVLHYGITIEPGAPKLRIHVAFLSNAELGAVGEDAIRKSIGERIGSAIEMSFERIAAEWPLTFTSGSAVLSRATLQQLESVAQVLKKYPTARCALAVTPADGKASTLLTQRVKAIRQFLTEKQSINDQRIGTEPLTAEKDHVVLRLKAS